nr:NtaA/DmoA family FMN-dependent monooxygenase [Staphylococcus succinus]
MTTLTAISQKTQYIGLIATISSTFYDPYNVARLLGSLDHISHGRVGMNIVTSQLDIEGQNHSLEKLPDLSERYDRADEFVSVLKQLWKSFDSKALIHDRTTGQGIDFSFVKEINHQGKHFQVKGPINLPSSPQVFPVLCQAGTSLPGRDLAAKHVDVIFSIAWNKMDAQSFSEDLSKRTETYRNIKEKPLILPGLTVYVGDTVEEAQSKADELDQFINIEHKLKQIERSIGQDVSHWAMDKKVPELSPYDSLTVKVGSKARYEAIRNAVETEHLTLRDLIKRVDTWMGHKTIIGDPTSIADTMQAWFEEDCCDGFILMPPTYPDMFEAFIDKVIPILQERGLFRTEYKELTLRERLKREVE